MSFPASVTTVTVTGRWRYADGSAAVPTGTVTFTPNAALQVPADGDLLPAKAVTARLDAQGEISVTLMSTADPKVQPSGWAYVVNEFVGGVERTYLAGFPAVAPGQTYDLADIAPAASDPVYTYVLLASVGTVGGPAGPLDADGLIPAGQIPGGGGGGVTSVNGDTGPAVVLDAADVGADAAGSAAAVLATSAQKAANLGDLANAGTARTNLGLGTAATHPAGDFDPAGAAATAQAAAIAASDAAGSAAAVLATSAQKAANLGDLANAATARANLALGTAATQNVGAFDAAGAAAAAQAASQPLDSDLTAFAALAAAGFVVRTGSGTAANRTLTGSTEAGVTNGDGVAGNPTLTVTAVAPTASAVGDTSTSGGVAAHRHAREGFAAPTGQNQGAGSAGASASVPHADHAHPYDLWSHLDHIGAGAWTMDPAPLAGQTTSTPTAGTIYVAKLQIPVALAGVTSIWLHVITAGTVLTAGQCFCALFDTSKNLLATSADQAAVWNSTGLKQTAIASSAVPTAAAYVGWFFNGTTGPRFHAGSNGIAAVNFGLSAANSRFATADTGRTTTMPATLGAFTATNNALWAAIS